MEPKYNFPNAPHLPADRRPPEWAWQRFLKYWMPFHHTLPQNMIPPVAPKSAIFLPTSQYSVCEDAKMMYAPSKYDSPSGAEIRYFFADYSI